MRSAGSPTCVAQRTCLVHEAAGIKVGDGQPIIVSQDVPGLNVPVCKPPPMEGLNSAESVVNQVANLMISEVNPIAPPLDDLPQVRIVLPVCQMGKSERNW